MQVSSSPTENRNTIPLFGPTAQAGGTQGTDEDKAGSSPEFPLSDNSQTVDSGASSPVTGSAISRTEMATVLQAQAEGGDSADMAMATEEEDESNSAREEFLAWAKMDWEERFFASWLAKEGMTQEEFEALPPEEKEKILKAIREAIEKEVESSSAKSESEVETQSEAAPLATGNPAMSGETDDPDGKTPSVFSSLLAEGKASSGSLAAEDLLMAAVQTGRAAAKASGFPGAEGGPRAEQIALQKDVDRLVSPR